MGPAQVVTDRELSDEEVAAVAASAVPWPSPEQDRALRKKMRRQLAIGVLVGAIGVLGTTMGIVGQSFSLRQARALERIGDQLEHLAERSACR